MHRKVDLLYGTYSNFEADVLARIRRKTFGEDFGQNSWTTAEEYRRWAAWLALDDRSHVLEIASGSGGPAIFLANLCGGRVTGIDINANGVATAVQRAQAQGLSGRVEFQQADANATLPFPAAAFEAIVCIDSANHLTDRIGMLKEWRRVLKAGGHALFTDPVVITGAVLNEELAIRSSIGTFLFTPPDANERLIHSAGLELARQEDVSENAAVVAMRWHDARAEEHDALVEIEGETRFVELQQFFAMVHRLTSERRLSRIAYLLRKPDAA